MHRYVDSEEPIPHIIKHRFSDVTRLNFNDKLPNIGQLQRSSLDIQGETTNAVGIGVRASVV